MRKLNKPRKYGTNCVEFYSGEITPVTGVDYFTHWTRNKTPGELAEEAKEATQKANEKNAGKTNTNSTR